MATTTNFGWETPDDTDLVKDGAAAIRTLGQSIDTSLADLEGGTTGQVLSKASNTDMDFTWVTTDDTNAIQNAIVDAKGDLIAATAADTPARLAIGTNGQLLTADSTAATGMKWATPAASASGLTFISATACSAVSSQAVTGFSSTYENYRIIYSGTGTADNYMFMKLRSSTTDSSTAYYSGGIRYFSTAASQQVSQANSTAGWEVGWNYDGCFAAIDVFQPFTTKRTGYSSAGSQFDTSVSRSIYTSIGGMHNATTSYDGFNLILGSGTFTGTVYLYGYQKS
jgi:hypothetical protein